MTVSPLIQLLTWLAPVDEDTAVKDLLSLLPLLVLGAGAVVPNV